MERPRDIPVTRFCKSCKEAADPGFVPVCIFKADVLTLIDQRQAGEISAEEGRNRLSSKSQAARTRACPNISMLRNELDRFVDPILSNRAHFKRTDVADTQKQPFYDRATGMKSKKVQSDKWRS
ncbi:MAG: hypothetical protein HY344_03715 [Candidatus Levybacteria bacterium]|nr:hypothetical protein [Candidatus Levybacteria bacterium]